MGPLCGLPSGVMLAAVLVGLALVVGVTGFASSPASWPRFTTPSGEDWQQACDPECTT